MYERVEKRDKENGEAWEREGEDRNGLQVSRSNTRQSEQVFPSRLLINAPITNARLMQIQTETYEPWITIFQPSVRQ